MILGYFFSSRKYWECKSLKLINIRIVHTIKFRLHLPLTTKLSLPKDCKDCSMYVQLGSSTHLQNIKRRKWRANRWSKHLDCMLKPVQIQKCIGPCVGNVTRRIFFTVIKLESSFNIHRTWPKCIRSDVVVCCRNNREIEEHNQA